MIKTIALAVVGLIVLAVAGVLIYAATKPDTFRVARTTSIKAPPEKIMPRLVDLRRQGEWSPWEHKDPQMKRTYSGAPSGKGAVYEWAGNKDIGSGRMEVLEVSPTRIVYKLDFLSPFEAHNMAELVLVPQGDSTAVTWMIYGPAPYVARIMHTFFNMDRMIGHEFETGLATLKTLSER
jgi:hypothetical protein